MVPLPSVPDAGLGAPSRFLPGASLRRCFDLGDQDGDGKEFLSQHVEEKVGDLRQVAVKTTCSVWLPRALLVSHSMASTKNKQTKKCIALLPTLWALSGSTPAAAVHGRGQHLTGQPRPDVSIRVCSVHIYTWPGWR